MPALDKAGKEGVVPGHPVNIHGLYGIKSNM